MFLSTLIHLRFSATNMSKETTEKRQTGRSADTYFRCRYKGVTKYDFILRHTRFRPSTANGLSNAIEFTFYYESFIEIIFMQIITQCCFSNRLQQLWARLEQYGTNCCFCCLLLCYIYLYRISTANIIRPNLHRRLICEVKIYIKKNRIKNLKKFKKKY